MDTKENRKKAYMFGIKDGSRRGVVFGQNNNLSGLAANLDRAYEKGWRKARGEEVPGPIFKTNGRKYELKFFGELTPKERSELDYVKEEDGERNSFFRFRNYPYDLGEFTMIAPPERLDEANLHPMSLRDYHGDFDDWDCYQSDSHSSGIVVRYARDEDGEIDPEFIIIGSYFFKS